MYSDVSFYTFTSKQIQRMHMMTSQPKYRPFNMFTILPDIFGLLLYKIYRVPTVYTSLYVSEQIQYNRFKITLLTRDLIGRGQVIQNVKERSE